jgi:hypothetical protein
MLEDQILKISSHIPDASRDDCLLFLWRLSIISVAEYMEAIGVTSRRTAYNRMAELNSHWGLAGDDE